MATAMIIAVLAPAKTLDFGPQPFEVAETRPVFKAKTDGLVQSLQSLSQARLKSLMSISDSLAKLNYERYRDFGKLEKKACIFAFVGQAYQSLSANTFTPEDIDYCNSHLRILSGLYGILRPKDQIQAYRLEMGTKHECNGAKNLYEYWKDDVSRELVKGLGTLSSKANGRKKAAFLINCASQEYFKCIDKDVLKDNGITIIHIMFPGPAIYAKMARGAMVRFMVESRAEDPEKLKEFCGVEGEWSFVKEKAITDFETEFHFHRGAPQASKTTKRKEMGPNRANGLGRSVKSKKR